jgi:hypothetical protein
MDWLRSLQKASADMKNRAQMLSDAAADFEQA